MTERRRPRLYDNAIRSLFGRTGVVTDVRDVAPKVKELTFQADPPAGGWQPGHDIELWVDEGIVRHYTACQTETDQFTVVADLVASGPGSRWAGQVTPGTPVEIAAGRHKDRPLAPGRAALLGDASTIGLFRAIQQHRAPDALVVIEAPAEAVAALRDWAPEFEFTAAATLPGESLDRRLEQLLNATDTRDAYFLAGHAQTVQRLRSALVDGGIPRRAVSSRAYWATGKTGL